MVAGALAATEETKASFSVSTAGPQSRSLSVILHYGTIAVKRNAYSITWTRSWCNAANAENAA